MKISIDLDGGGKTIIDHEKIRYVVPYPEGSEIVMADQKRLFALNRLDQKNLVAVHVGGLSGVKTFKSINELSRKSVVR